MVKNPPVNAGACGFNPSSGQSPHAAGQLSPCPATEPVLESRVPRREKPPQREATATRSPHTSTWGVPAGHKWRKPVLSNRDQLSQKERKNLKRRIGVEILREEIRKPVPEVLSHRGYTLASLKGLPSTYTLPLTSALLHRNYPISAITSSPAGN